MVSISQTVSSTHAAARAVHSHGDLRVVPVVFSGYHGVHTFTCYVFRPTLVRRATGGLAHVGPDLAHSVAPEVRSYARI